MVIIDKITIRYFRSIYTLDLKGCKDATIFTGQNDVGKSNIIKALNLFFNNESDWNKAHNFQEDYSLLRKENVRKDSIRGQQFISITVFFIKGARMPNSLPDKFSVTRRWDLSGSSYKESTDVMQKMKLYCKAKGLKFSEKTTTATLSKFLHRIEFIYIPAIKDSSIFDSILYQLQQSLMANKGSLALASPIKKANELIKELMNELETDFEKSTGIKSRVSIPYSLDIIKGLVNIQTDVEGLPEGVLLEKRGDGIRAHYIPKILDYISRTSDKLYIWGFEEPENSYEYRRCLQVANEFFAVYSIENQIFITSHSPAFYAHESDRIKIFRICQNNGKTELSSCSETIDEELGYADIYKHYVDQIEQLEKIRKDRDEVLASLTEEIKQSKCPILLTEGKTDSSLLKLAIQKLNIPGFEDWIIKPVSLSNASCNDALEKALLSISQNSVVERLVIGMFDRDANVTLGQNDIRLSPFRKLSKYVYSFAIPVPHNRPEENDISIEHYFTDEEIRTNLDGKRLFMGIEFHNTGCFKGDANLFYKGLKVCGTIKIIEHETKCYVTDKTGTEDYSISKARFVECIEKGEPGFKNISFEEFRKIFSIIEAITADTK